MIRRSKGERIFSVFNLIFMLLILLVTAYPIYFCVIASFSDPDKLSMNFGAIWLPFQPFTLSAYQKVFSHSLFVSGWLNTLFVVIVGTLVNMVMTVLTAFVLSRKGLLLNRFFTVIIVFTMYFSGGMVPAYLNVKNLGLINSLWSLILPGAISTYNMIIMRTAFQSVPEELSESAQIDGASPFVIMCRILVPLCMPTIAVLVLYYAVGHWNSWFNASIYLQNSSKFPMQLVMKNILDSANVTEMIGDIGGADKARYVELIKYALIVVSTFPIMVLYPFLQKYFVKGVMVGAVKG
ncbi:MAG TPA: carbohydrate ABC transporter permease [Candidatus Eisenbergiella merdipullorum]|uniref:Carbohydrate ABC transporter permease n=1 Tax=Candidatus Eisenbergiella merdipullorum TaxID=2838553 RepID=A0A9D2I5S2_9FIRM|nr:carbohydrate ABC transporter permease [Candidatus Eisenbergiella merdipullorum]